MNTSEDCKICYDRYNRVDKKPYLINPCCDCYCKSCLDKLETQICPGCRGDINSIIINRPILNLLEEAPTGQILFENILKYKKFSYFC